MGITFSVEQYLLVVYACRNGELSKEQALVDINKKYKKSLKYIKQKMTDIMNEYRFYRFVSGGIDGLIKIYETMDHAFEAERENHLNIYTKIINDYLSEDELGETQKLDFDMARIEIIEERSKIAELCRDKRIITEYYEKSVADIMNIESPIDISNYEEHYFMQTLKHDAKQAFEVMKKAIQKGLVEYKDNYFNFKCNKGCVGLIFAETGYTDYKRISQHILINGEKCDLITLQNTKKNAPPKEWSNMSKILFGTKK